MARWKIPKNSDELRHELFGIHAQIFDRLREDFALDETFFRQRVKRADDGGLRSHREKPAQPRPRVAAAKTVRAERELSARNPRCNLIRHGADVVRNGDE